MRVMLGYPNGKKTYGIFDDSDGVPKFVFGLRKIPVKDLADLNVYATVSDQEIAKKIENAGMVVKEPAKQYTITISVKEEIKDRLNRAARYEGRSVSSILEQLGREWLNDNGY